MKQDISNCFLVLLLFLQLGSGKAQGVERFDYQYDYTRIGLEEGLPTLDINALVKGPKGFYWLATNGAGLVRFDGLEFKSYRSEQDPAINALIRFRDSLLAYVTGEKLVFFDGRQFQEMALPDLRVEKLVSAGKKLAFLDRKGRSWLFADSAFKNLAVTDSLLFKDLQFKEGMLYGLAQKGLYRWRDGRWEQLLRQGGSNFINKSLAFLRQDSLFTSTGTFLSLSPMTFRGISVQAEGSLFWSGRHWLFAGESDTVSASLPEQEKGLEILAAHGRPEEGLLIHSNKGLLLWQRRPLGRLVLPKQNILSLAVWRQGLVMGTTRGVLWIKENGQTQKIGANLGSVLDLAVFQGRLFLATERGLYVHDGKSLRLTGFPEPGFIFSLEASALELWIGTGLGIYRYDGQRFQAQAPLHDLPTATIFDIQLAEDGSLWCGTYTKGIWRFYQGSWQIYRSWQGLAFGEMSLSCFKAISAGELYLGTLNKGLFHLEASQVRHYDFEDLAFAEARAMLLSERGALWIGTNKGMVSLGDLQERQRSGIPLVFYGGEVNAHAALRGEAGLYFGGPESLGFLQAFGPEDQVVPAITGFDLFGRPQTDLTNFAEGQVPFSGVPQALQLPHDRNYLRAQLSPKTLLGAGQVYYRYRLVGQEKTWSEVGHRRELIFSALPAGTYRLEVQARRPGTEYQAAYTQVFSFQINRPLWKNPWFIGGLAGVLLALLILFVLDRNRRSRQRLELENQLMEMERKALRLQMNPHFIFNALDSISSFIFKKDPRQAVRYLNNFAKLMRLTLESSMEHVHPVETEVSILKNYLELEKLRFGDRFHFEIVVDEAIDYDVGLPPMLLQPHVENAILHGLKPREVDGFLKITFRLKDDLLEVIIEDNGVGRVKAKEQRGNRRHRSMATQINRDRMALLKRSMNEHFSLEIIDKYDQTTGQASGTRVEIRLPAEAL